MPAAERTLCWTPLTDEGRPGPGMEHLRLRATSADGMVLGVDEEQGPFRLHYQLRWTLRWQLRSAALTLATSGSARTLRMETDGQGRWRDGTGRPMGELEGCLDIDIWPTPFTNTLPIRLDPLAIGERRCIQVAWVFGPTLGIRKQAQAYTRLEHGLYRFESLDGSGFTADIAVDSDGLVLDYPDLFRRLRTGAGGGCPGGTVDQ